MEDTIILWAVLLIAGALLLFFLEIFIPTGGLLGVVAAGALVGGIIMLFYRNQTLGIIGTITSLIALPIMLGLGLKVLPNTPIFKRLTLSNQQAAPPANAAEHTLAHDQVQVGQTGKAVTEMHPIGMCLINGQRVQCLAERSLIQSGTRIEVVSVDGMHTKVRAI